MELKRVAPGSAFKVAGGIYGALGLVIGCLFSLFALVGAGIAGNSEAGFAGALFGVGAIVIIPIFYGLLGAVMAAIMASLYNLIARLLGGLELELE